jgi:hypothetical protein
MKKIKRIKRIKDGFTLTGQYPKEIVWDGKIGTFINFAYYQGKK